MATKKKSKSKVNGKPAAKRRIPRQDALPGMGDAKIAAIETAALDYAEIRDKRQELTAEESSLKMELLHLMKKLGKTEYKRNGISVNVLIEKEKVKVRVREEGEEPKPKKSKQTDFDVNAMVTDDTAAVAGV